MPTFRASALFASLGLALTPFAQQPGPNTLQVSTRLVVLDVSVRDAAGHLVNNLDKTHFVITEDGTTQTLRYFEAPAQHTLPPGKMLVASSADLPKIGTAPVTLLVLDELNTPFADRAYAQTMMIKYLQRQPEILPSPTLLVAAGDAHFKVLHDYTQSRADLLESVKRHFPDYPWNLARNNAGEQMSRTMGALDMIADSSRGTPGRKNVIWVGLGYPSIDETGMSQHDADELNAAIETVTRRLLNARVTLYTIDPGGPQVTPPAQVVSGSGDASAGAGPALGPFDPSDVDFTRFATATGGRTLFARNDVDTEISEQIGEGNSYYTLSYVPSGASNAAQTYRRIRITMTDPHLTATTRDGYFPTGPAVEKVETDQGKKQPTQLSFDIVSAAQTNLIYTGLHVEASRISDGYSLKVGAAEMGWTSLPDGHQTAEVTVFAVAYNAKGVAIGDRATQLTEQIGAANRIDPASRVTLIFHFPLPPATARVRLVVRDSGTGAIGTADAKP